MSKKLPSPCMDVCKYKRAQHCVACSMTKAQKSLFKSLKRDKYREAFLLMLLAQQEQIGRFETWPEFYRKRSAKKGAVLPAALAKLLPPAGRKKPETSAF